jgi:hypothetical protein
METDICVQVFGKPFSQLDAAERALFQRANRAASYYRSYAANVAKQRGRRTDQRMALACAAGLPEQCGRCGYDRCHAALEFHHPDPAVKDGLVRTVEEARKCELICSNCHREHHLNTRSLGGRPPKALHPIVAAYLDACGVVRP